MDECKDKFDVWWQADGYHYLPGAGQPPEHASIARMAWYAALASQEPPADVMSHALNKIAPYLEGVPDAHLKAVQIVTALGIGEQQASSSIPETEPPAGAGALLRNHNYSYKEPYGDMKAGFYYCLCGWEGPDRSSYWKHLEELAPREPEQKRVRLSDVLKIIEMNGCKPGDIVETEGKMQTFMAGMNKSMQMIYKAVASLAAPVPPVTEAELQTMLDKIDGVYVQQLAAPVKPSTGERSTAGAGMPNEAGIAEGMRMCAEFLEREADANFMPNEPTKLLIRGFATAIRVNMKAFAIGESAATPDDIRAAFVKRDTPAIEAQPRSNQSENP